MELHFYSCDVCGKVTAVLSREDVPTECCGKPMTELIPNTADGAAEKHVPVYTVIGNLITVKVGSDPHPMTESHYISWIGLKTSRGFQFKELDPTDSPKASFLLLPGEKAEAVYGYCNLHGLWIAEKGGSLL